MSNERYRGQRLGYLEYHIDVLQERMEQLDAELHTIRTEHSGKQKKLKERSALINFQQDVRQSIDKIQYQINGVKQHESDKALATATRQRDSSYQVHQEDNDESVKEPAFTPASDLEQ